MSAVPGRRPGKCQCGPSVSCREDFSHPWLGGSPSLLAVGDGMKVVARERFVNPLLQAMPVQAYLEDLHERLAGVLDGEVASYIPELSRADPNWFGIALVTVDGNVYQVGDSHQEFTIQSISKAITYVL